MLVVEAEGLKVRFSFYHTKPEYREPLTPDEVQYTDEAGMLYIPAQTDCTLEVTDLSTGKVNEYLGFAICHQNDQFRKEIGRKISLQRALAEAFPGIDDVEIIGPQEVAFNRSIRKLVWLRYHNRHLGNAAFAENLPELL